VAKLISTVLAVIVGAVLAVGAAYGVATSQTKAPNTNPASKQIIDYGSTN
jgi:hypothetical protein